MAGAIARGIAVGVIDALSEANGGTPDPTPVPETECEAARREYLVMHPTPTKLPPQLRCGVNGEWGMGALPE